MFEEEFIGKLYNSSDPLQLFISKQASAYQVTNSPSTHFIPSQANPSHSPLSSSNTSTTTSPPPTLHVCVIFGRNKPPSFSLSPFARSLTTSSSALILAKTSPPQGFAGGGLRALPNTAPLAGCARKLPGLVCRLRGARGRVAALRRCGLPSTLWACGWL